MVKYEIKRECAGNSASECYQAGLRTVQSAGYTVIKKRDIASLVICQALVHGSRVDLNLMVPLVKPTSVVLNLSSEQADQAALKVEADRVLGILANVMGLG